MEEINLRAEQDLLRDKVFHILKENIINGKIKNGERLVESSLANKMGVSRTPVREALHLLKREGLVIEESPKKMVAKQIEIDDVIEIYEIRAVLEGLSAKLAAERRNEDDLLKLKKCLAELEERVEKGDQEQIINCNRTFHNIIDTCSKSPRLYKDINNYREYIEYFRQKSLLVKDRPRIVLKKHKEIFRAINEKDPEKTEKIVRNHILNAKDVLLESGIIEQRF